MGFGGRIKLIGMGVTFLILTPIIWFLSKIGSIIFGAIGLFALYGAFKK